MLGTAPCQQFGNGSTVARAAISTFQERVPMLTSMAGSITRLWGHGATDCGHEVWLVGFAQACHPEFEQLDIVLLGCSKDTQELLGVLFGSTVHLGEFKKDLHFAVENQTQHSDTTAQSPEFWSWGPSGFKDNRSPTSGAGIQALRRDSTAGQRPTPACLAVSNCQQLPPWVMWLVHQNGEKKTKEKNFP